MADQPIMRLSEAGLEYTCFNCGKFRHLPHAPDGLLMLSRLLKGLPQPLCETCERAVEEALKAVKNRPVGEA